MVLTLPLSWLFSCAPGRELCHGGGEAEQPERRPGGRGAAAARVPAAAAGDPGRDDQGGGTGGRGPGSGRQPAQHHQLVPDQPVRPAHSCLLWQHPPAEPHRLQTTASRHGEEQPHTFTKLEKLKSQPPPPPHICICSHSAGGSSATQTAATTR